MKNTLIGLGVVATIIGGGVALDPQIEVVDWSYSVGVPDFNGDLGVGEWGVTDTGQIFFNIDGKIRSFDDYDNQFSLKEIETLKEKKYRGVRYEDVFKDGSKDIVSQIDYLKLKENIRKPEKTKLRLANLSEAAITQTSSASTHTSYVNSVTYALDCTGATNSGVLVFISNRTLGDITGVTYNGDTMTNDVESLNNNVTGHEVWSLKASDIGNYNVVISNSQYRLHTSYATCLSGTDQTTLVEASTSVTPSYSNSVTGSVTSLTDNAWIFTGINLQNNYSLTPDSGEIELYDEDNSDSNLGRTGVSYLEKATAGNETMGWSWSSSDNYTMILVAIKPSVVESGGAGPTSTLKGGGTFKGGVIIK